MLSTWKYSCRQQRVRGGGHHKESVKGPETIDAEECEEHALQGVGKYSMMYYIAATAMLQLAQRSMPNGDVDAQRLTATAMVRLEFTIDPMTISSVSTSKISLPCTLQPLRGFQ